MEHYFFVAWFVSVVADRSSVINLPECSSCSGRADVPCMIKKMPFPCDHSEYHEFWPAKPRDLQVRKEEIEKDKWLANFTWNPPYDASITSLEGFFLTVHIVAHMATTIHIGPLCFYANLSGTNWTSINDPHSVTFYFDCIMAEVKTEISLFLMSSPTPDHNAEFTEMSIEIGDIDPTEETIALKINKTVVTKNGDAKVKVWFGPVDPDTAYHMICLSPERTHYAYCEKRVNLTGPQQVYTFTNVPSGYYKLMIRRSSEAMYYVTAKFFVPVPPPVIEPQGLDSIQISVIIVGCILVLIMIAGTYCVLKRYQIIKYCDFVRSCVFFSSYQPTSQIQPNNNNDQIQAIKKQVVVIFYPESMDFIKAVEDFCALVRRWGDCNVITYQNMCIEELHHQQNANELCNGQYVIVIFSKHIGMIYNILKQDENLPPNLDVPSQFLFGFLKKIYSEGTQETVISFLPLKVENLLLKAEKMLQMTETRGIDLEIYKANENHICQLFHKIHDNQFSESSFRESLVTGNEQVKHFLESVQKLPRPVSPNRYSSVRNNNIDQSNFSSKLCEKHLKTLKWTEEQNSLKNGHTQIKWPCGPSSQPLLKDDFEQKDIYEPLRNANGDLTWAYERNRFQCHGKRPLRANTSVRGLREDSMYPTSRPEGLLDEHGEFLPPDSDSESESASMVCENIKNINRRYIENLKQQTSQL